MKRLIVLLLILLVAMSGCVERTASDDFRMQAHEYDFVLLLAVDQEYVATKGKAYEFVCRVLDEYFRHRASGNSLVIISQLSGDRPLLWEGSPRQLREEFSSKEKFQQWMLGHKAEGKRINEGLAKSLNFLMRSNSVASGKARAVALVMSSMDEPNAPPEADLQSTEAMARFHKAGGGIGFYFCDQNRLDYVEQKMTNAGCNIRYLECDIFGRPQIPSFE